MNCEIKTSLDRRRLNIQCNLSKPDPNGTKYFVRFRQDPDYSDSSFLEEFLHFSCFDNKVCLLLDGLAYILHFIHLFYVNQMLKVFIQMHLKKEVHFNNQSFKQEAMLMFLQIK